MAGERDLDIALYGATGFTGGLTAEYLATSAPAETRWALAGRDRAKLEAVRTRLAKINPICADLALVHADSTDPASLAALAAQARCVVTTVGPYVKYGEPLVAACAGAGTDYLDLTGEPGFVDDMYLRHHATALSSGARLVHCCGFDSIPHDLGVLFTVLQLPEGVPLRIDGYVRAGGRPSGGTFNTMLEGAPRFREWQKLAAKRKQVEPRPENRKVRAARPLPGRAPDGGWSLPMPTIDPQIVLRSARALDRYGPDFTYTHNVAPKHLATAAGLVAGTASLILAAQISPVRRFLGKRLAPGDGPSAEQRAKGWFKVRFTGEGGGKRVVTQVSGGDPGYGETARMLGESALCITRDELPDRAGQLTPAVAMGEALIDRLDAIGIAFEVLERG